MQWHTRRKVIDLSQRGMVMGIVNTTPDSFSDGGNYLGDNAVEYALKLQREGAEIIDVGGESTRPGAQPVALDEELNRVIPVIKGLREASDVLISIDTSKAEVAKQSIIAGADIVNDVTGFQGDPGMVEVCEKGGVGVVVMHMQGNPKTMQDSPYYEDVVRELCDYFEERYTWLTSRGIKGDSICFDPGIGFGKRHEHNLKLLSELESLVKNRSMMLGVSRKSFIGKTLGIEDPKRRDAATLALTVHGRAAGCMLHRVHAVKENVEAIRMLEEVIRYG